MTYFFDPFSNRGSGELPPFRPATNLSGFSGDLRSLAGKIVDVVGNYLGIQFPANVYNYLVPYFSTDVLRSVDQYGLPFTTQRLTAAFSNAYNYGYTDEHFAEIFGYGLPGGIVASKLYSVISQYVGNYYKDPSQVSTLITPIHSIESVQSGISIVPEEVPYEQPPQTQSVLLDLPVDRSSVSMEIPDVNTSEFPSSIDDKDGSYEGEDPGMMDGTGPLDPNSNIPGEPKTMAHDMTMIDPEGNLVTIRVTDDNTTETPTEGSVDSGSSDESISMEGARENDSGIISETDPLNPSIDSAVSGPSIDMESAVNDSGPDVGITIPMPVVPVETGIPLWVLGLGAVGLWMLLKK
jgi:hypothetical protein